MSLLALESYFWIMPANSVVLLTRKHICLYGLNYRSAHTLSIHCVCMTDQFLNKFGLAPHLIHIIFVQAIGQQTQQESIKKQISMQNISMTYLHDIFIDLLGVPVDQVDLFGVTVPQDFLLVGVVLVRHTGGPRPKTGWIRRIILEEALKEGAEVNQPKESCESGSAVPSSS